ncbi:glycosyltransferase [Vibrio algarum]|uniref:Glycosyltransferase n=1 Tax=Vibrio algarum TaxID=3020714 RepID=A0ABT4YR79_9VIBR|nr:glycosyltransferase [Vibrio sp. KJ40-1]MDB1123711.1 glycosyltransferase [Vibrio sp. KJ40-1]
MEKVHICHLVYSFDVGGLERVIANCINQLDRERFSHSIIALTSVGAFIREIDSPVKHYSLEKRIGNDFSSHLKLFKLLRKIKPDVLHSYNLATIEYHWMALLAGVKYRVHAEHGRDTYDPDGKVNKYKLIRRICSPIIHKIIAVSDDLLQWLQSDVRIPEKKLALVRNGVDTVYFNKNSIPVTDISKEEFRFVFGHVARLHGIKNQTLLINSFLSACERDSKFCENCGLVLVGDGPDKTLLENLVKDNNVLKDKVKFTGAQQNVRSHYASFDVFVMSSVAEGIPMTLLESMSMSVPHIVTSVGGIQEVIVQNETGLAVGSNDQASMTDAMLAMFASCENRASMSFASRTRITSQFSQSKMVADYAAIYLKQEMN